MLLQELTDFFYDSPLAFMKAVPFEKAVFDKKAEYMCKFGCKKYNRSYSCPPESYKLFKKIKDDKFKWVLLVATTYDFPKDYSRFKMKIENSQKEMEIQRISTQLDKIMSKSGLDYTILSGGCCKKCRECSVLNNQKCKKPSLRLTSMESVGIDCQKTMHIAGFDFGMPNSTSINRCAAIFFNTDEICSVNLQKRESFQKYSEISKNQVEKLCSNLLQEFPQLFESIELKSIFDLEIKDSDCTINCKNIKLKNFSCPPYSNKLELNLWTDFILWKWRYNNTKKYSYNTALKKIHSAFFSVGFYFALSLRDCYCDECSQCTFSLSDKPVCNHRKLLSPSMQSQGIYSSYFGKGKYGIELLHF
jgi:predicted metal-binding protein